MQTRNSCTVLPAQSFLDISHFCYRTRLCCIVFLLQVAQLQITHNLVSTSPKFSVNRACTELQVATITTSAVVFCVIGLGLGTCTQGTGFEMMQQSSVSNLVDASAIADNRLTLPQLPNYFTPKTILFFSYVHT
jgi:hypothetical protein